MSTSFNNIVNNTEQAALKEMIFKRARERAEALNADTQSNYTSNIHRDIMELAHATLAVDKNPFAKQIEAENEPVEDSKVADITDVGFPPRKQDDVRANIQENNKFYSEYSAAKAIINNMEHAHEELAKKQSFLGALEFLNTQASMSLMRTKDGKFNMLA